MREIILDTETTGLDPNEGHRLVEIGCVEMIDRNPTGATWHKYFNPERDMPVEAFNVHGLSAEFLSDKPLFAELAQEFVDFVGDAHLVIHNAGFDMRFLNAELKRVNLAALAMDRVIDTLAMARRKHPGARASLDELCQRYGIDNSKRVKHGALLDAEILAEVYIELTGGRQTALSLASASAAIIARAGGGTVRPRPKALPSRIRPEELAAHEAFITGLGENALWKKYAP
ncbi:DNA polymerase III subunit epsilon [Labrys okinawensis]|uniref:DNA polymerase III subunit epsilon n=1 Tax=Labrys okinawensis TaxID=346911 RepID=A0A2S9QGU4_9HYPH|nr:DNA polymerase III subunit epsilon [Labrys okinawensis]PRH88586.1 DNA polymerase III subunit epsilon [Labrys okinawensis]